MKTYVVAFSIVALSLAAVPAFGQASNTGAGIANPGGTLDPDWTVTLPLGMGSGTVQAMMLNHGVSGETGGTWPYTAYAANTNASQWISFAVDGGDSLPSAQTTGNFVYKTVVNFGTSGTLSGHLWSDNSLLDITVGANSFGQAPLSIVHGVGSTSWFQSGSAFAVSGSFSGSQLVTFTIQNGYPGYTADHDPTAFRAQFNPVPEPFTMGLGIAAIGMAARRRLKAKSA